MEPPPPQVLSSQPQHFSVRRYNHRGEGGGPMEMTKEHAHSEISESSSAGERCGGGEMRRAPLDFNLASLCDHIQLEGFNNGVFSDVVLKAMGSTYHLHRLILSRSSYFRNMLQGPWKEANAPVLTLNVDDSNVNGEAMEIALACLYGHYPKLNDNNAFRVLAAASFLDLQDLCAICTDFIIAELWSSNFLTYQVFAESQDYGSHGERVRNACWGYLCQSGARELKEVLPKLSSQTLLALLTSDELWVPSEEKRFELALFTLLAKGTACKIEHHEQESGGCDVRASTDPSRVNRNYAGDGSTSDMLETEKGCRKSKDEVEGRYAARKILVELADSIVDSHSNARNFSEAQTLCGESNMESTCDCSGQRPSGSNTLYTDDSSASFSHLNIGLSGLTSNGLALDGPSDEDSCYQLNSSWPPGSQIHCMSMSSSCNVLMPNEWERCNMSPLTWGGRIVGRREVNHCLKRHYGMSREDYDSFINLFEGGSLLYCNMSFEALLNARKHLEEMGFPCKAVNDGLWLQMLLSQRLQEIGADTCRNCCRMSIACVCRQPFRHSTGVTAPGYYMQDHEHNNLPPNEIGHVYINTSQGERNGLFRPVRVHDRGPIDGLAGIGRGTSFSPAAAWPPTRYVFSRVPLGIGNRNSQQAPAHDGPDNRPDSNVDLAGDGLTVLVGLSMGSNEAANVHEVQLGREFETGLQSRQVGSLTSGSTASGIPMQMIESPEHAMGIEWENVNSSISLDLKTPLNHFPPFRFAVEFQDVHRLCDGQVKHSPEAFYAGSFWKVSVQAFSDEDPQGRRTLGLFLHRRKAEIIDPLRKVHVYVDSREKVTARYQLICPSKREVMVFGSYKQTGTLLPKAPKGWGWRSALLFDELGDLLQNGTLRVAAVVQLI